jgi:uncharacterized membrane protein
MRLPFSPITLFLMIGAMGFIVVIIQIGALTIAFDKLGLSAFSALLLLGASLAGSAINLPLFTLNAAPQPQRHSYTPWRSVLRIPYREFTGKTLIAINVGGGVLPIAFSIYLLGHNPLSWSSVVVATAVVAAVSRAVSRPVPGLGIGMPVLVAPLTAAIVALVIESTYSAPLAYICGTLGVLIGADLMRFNMIRRFGAPFASVGGAGTFDGIFITGIVAALIA